MVRGQEAKAMAKPGPEEGLREETANQLAYVPREGQIPEGGHTRMGGSCFVNKVLATSMLARGPPALTPRQPPQRPGATHSGLSTPSMPTCIPEPLWLKRWRTAGLLLTGATQVSKTAGGRGLRAFLPPWACLGLAHITSHFPQLQPHPTSHQSWSCI